ncbi:MAG: hypothetical protein ACFFD5_15285 [Candidatus Thorarchaeota archaeon]
MESNLLTKFLKLMSKNISESDLDLIQLGKTLGLDLVSFADLRASQDDIFVNTIRDTALKKMEKFHDNYLSNNDSFYAGSVDFMVCDYINGKKFFLLETNGGSHRGLSIITKDQQNILYDGYYEAIHQAIINDKRRDGKVFVLVGVPVNDGLIHEKIIMVEYLRKKLKSNNFKVKIFNTNNYNKDFEASIIFLIADYKQLSDSLSYSENWLKYKSDRISVIIGDGVVRRFKNDSFSKIISKDFRKIQTIFVNPIYKITDDKSLTYLASYFSKKHLNRYNLKYLLFTKAFNEKDLINKLKYLIEKYNQEFIIKPSGGSGGAGIVPISKDSNTLRIKKMIKLSKKEFFAKFTENRDPYPYTIQEKANFSLIDWRNGRHTFDLRIYLALKDKKVIPVGGLARIARGAYITGVNKQEFVVNLSGYDGQIEVERGIGFSEESSKILNLNSEDFINMFCIGCVIFKSIVENYEKIINFSDWEKIIG